MKKETLLSLLVDRDLGELTPETRELLDAYLAAEPAARAVEGSVGRTLGVVREAVRGQPVPVEDRSGEAAQPAARGIPFGSWPSLLARAAALAVLMGICAWAGFRGGAARQPAGQAPIAAGGAARPDAGELRHQWAVYEVAYDARQSGFTVRSSP